MKRRWLVPVTTLVIGVGGTCAALAVSTSFGHPASHPAPAASSAWTMDQLSDEDVSYFLANVLPYYRVDAPSYCPEDAACWIGTNQDSRTDRQILGALREDLVTASESYGG